MADKESSSASGAQTVTRAIQVLKLVASQPGEGIRLVDVSQLLDLRRSTAHRLLQALTTEGALVQHSPSRRYSLGALVFELGLAASHRFNLISACQPALATLSKRLGDTSFLFVRSGSDAVCLARVPGSFAAHTPVVPVGSRQPLGVSAGGLAILSALPSQEMQDAFSSIELRLPAYGKLDLELVRQHVSQAQRHGYARIANHAVPGITAVGLPIFNEEGQPIAAVTVATTHVRMSEKRIVTEVVPGLQVAARQIVKVLHQ
jgi:DNA-binding IclR family transcriptional regulator